MKIGLSAALLHDAAEDQGGAETLDDIRKRFGDAVAEIVADCTDALTEPKPDWRPRKEAYLAKLPAADGRTNGLSVPKHYARRGWQLPRHFVW